MNYTEWRFQSAQHVFGSEGWKNGNNICLHVLHNSCLWKNFPSDTAVFLSRFLSRQVYISKFLLAYKIDMQLQHLLKLEMLWYSRLTPSKTEQHYLSRVPLNPKYHTAMLDGITMVVKESQHKSQPLCYAWCEVIPWDWYYSVLPW